MKGYTLKGSDIEDLKILNSFLKNLPLEISGGTVAECYVFSEKKPIEKKQVRKQEEKQEVEIKKIGSVDLYPAERIGFIDEVKEVYDPSKASFTFDSLKAGTLMLRYEGTRLDVHLKSETELLKEKVRLFEEKLKHVKTEYEITDEDLDLEKLGIK